MMVAMDMMLVLVGLAVCLMVSVVVLVLLLVEVVAPCVGNNEMNGEKEEGNDEDTNVAEGAC